jgi:hypothetical protein
MSHYIRMSTEDLLSSTRGLTFPYSTYDILRKRLAIILWPSWLRCSLYADRSIYCCYEVNHCRTTIVFNFTADGKGVCVRSFSEQHTLEFCAVLARLVTRCRVHSLVIDTALIRSRTLSYLMEHCQSLKCLELRQVHLDEDDCRVLGEYSRPDLDIELIECRVEATALAEILGRNRGPTKLDFCYVDNVVIADGLRRNTRLRHCKITTVLYYSRPGKRLRELHDIIICSKLLSSTLMYCTEIFVILYLHLTVVLLIIEVLFEFIRCVISY